MTEVPSTVDEYIRAFGEKERSRLAELRAVVRAGAPHAVEELKWRAPAFVHPDGVILVMLSGHKLHTNVVFTPSTKDAFAEELEGLETGKGSVKIPYVDPVPRALLKRMVQHRVHEYEDQGVKWM
jgi:uncharacterized protein YdhG (YjbR/CyaY superfamily)